MGCVLLFLVLYFVLELVLITFTLFSLGGQTRTAGALTVVLWQRNGRYAQRPADAAPVFASLGRNRGALARDGSLARTSWRWWWGGAAARDDVRRPDAGPGRRGAVLRRADEARGSQGYVLDRHSEAEGEFAELQVFV